MKRPGNSGKVPALSQLYFYLTEGCNCRCRHCWLAPSYESGALRYPVLDLSIYRSVLDQALDLGLELVKLSGGEPLMHPQIEEIIQVVADSDRLLSLETNGLLCSEPIVERIARCRQAFVSLSLDGSDAQTHEWVRGVEGSFKRAVQAIEMLSGAGIRTQVVMSLLPHNLRQVEEVVLLAGQSGAESVKFNVVQPTERGKNLRNAGKAVSIREHIALAREIEAWIAPRAGIELIYDLPAAFKPLSRIFSSSEGADCGVCGILGSIGVLPDGRYALCGVGSKIDELVFGDAGDERLKAVWENNDTLIELRAGIPGRLEGICRSCLMKNGCRGKCIAQNYYQAGSLWAPFWFCQEAWEQGLFPQTREVPEK